MIEKITENTSSNITEAIVEIHKQCISQANYKKENAKTIEEWLSQISVSNTVNQFDNYSWVVIKEDKGIVGFAQYSLEEGYINQFQIAPSQQRNGYGKKLYRYIEEDFKNNNKKIIKLDSVNNAFKFYKSMGFKKKNHFVLPFKKKNLIEMEKEIE